MIRICPNPEVWTAVFERLAEYAKRRPCSPPSPPKILILAGWNGTNDIEKKERWEETVAWAKANDCADIVERIPDTDFYVVETPSTYVVGPFGGPMYRPWDFESKTRPTLEQLKSHLRRLQSRWGEIVTDAAISRATKPIAFTGPKARSLLVQADPAVQPPWGSWSQLSKIESERRMFTAFRSAINKAIAPHEIDHVQFTIDRE